MNMQHTKKRLIYNEKGTGKKKLLKELSKENGVLLWKISSRKHREFLR
jgi:hypothetical protein